MLMIQETEAVTVTTAQGETITVKLTINRDSRTQKIVAADAKLRGADGNRLPSFVEWFASHTRGLRRSPRVVVSAT